MAAGNTYVALASTTLGSAAGDVTFSSISGAYTDLVLVINCTAGTAAKISFRLNGDSGSNYSRITVDGYGGSVATDLTSGNAEANTSRFNATTSRATLILNFMSYSNATTYKTVLTRTSDASSHVVAGANLWRSTAAITSIVVTQSDFSTGSTFTLYGIAAA